MRIYLVAIDNSYDGGGSIQSFSKDDKAILAKEIELVEKTGCKYYVIEGVLMETNDEDDLEL